MKFRSSTAKAARSIQTCHQRIWNWRKLKNAAKPTSRIFYSLANGMIEAQYEQIEREQAFIKLVASKRH